MPGMFDPANFNPAKIDEIAMHFPPEPFAAELDRISQMGSNMITQLQIPGTEQAPQPGTADFSFLQPGAAPAPAAPGNAPLPAGAMGGLGAMMQQQTPAMRPPAGTMPKKTQFPQLPKAGRAQQVPNLHQILYGGK